LTPEDQATIAAQARHDVMADDDEALWSSRTLAGPWRSPTEDMCLTLGAMPMMGEGAISSTARA
jgi:hypothetical protein